MAKNDNLADKAYQRLREEIILGKLIPGDKLPEIVLAKRLEMSRTPIREAVNHLIRDGLAESTKSGAIVRSYTMDEVIELYALRELVEVYAAAQAVDRIGAEALSQLEFCCDEFDRLIESIRKRRLENLDCTELGNELALNDFTFHMIVIGQAPNRFVRKLSLDLRIAMLSVFRAGIIYPLVTPKRIEEKDSHRPMYQAIKSRDVEQVRKLFFEHISDSRQALERAFGKSPEAGSQRNARSIMRENMHIFD
ncbi:MAG: GntR family transcriptional regulator [Victivallaceae bacterium]|nr:GntR family transcriptional regulator [Victivallaceae bacterium]